MAVVEHASAPESTDAAPPRRRRRRARLVLRYALLTIGAVIVLFPLYMAAVNSLLAPSQIAHQPPPFFPVHPEWGTYTRAWTEGDLGIYLRNSAIQTSVIVVGQMITSVLAAYAFAFLEFPFKRTLFFVFLMTLMIPFEVTITTNLSTISSLGWFNTFPGLTVPFLATGFGTFLLRQSFLQIPRDLREAAQLDGYGHVRFLWSVAVPMARPALAALGVFSFLGAWNQYLWPLLVTGDDNSVRTVQIGLKQLLNTQLDQINVSLAGTVIAVAPLLILLVVFQKQLVRSLTSGAVK
ncbi:MAG: carbohydrate ABC transporter permease [Acidimicrobiales bacterium]|jgi:ABC-type glycerol-3-phosphate transport system permease component